MDKLLAIRADGNNEIGWGHLVRTQALARQLHKRGVKVIFFTRTPENITDYQTIAVSVPASEEDAWIRAELDAQKACAILVDSYEYDHERLERISEWPLPSAYIDDLNLTEFNVNWVINGNLYAPDLNYRGRAQFLLGSKYLLLRDDFTNLPTRLPREKVENVLLTFGAVDNAGVTLDILKKMYTHHNFNSYQWHVVIGPAFSNQLAEQIELVCKSKNNILLHKRPDMKSLMMHCDVALSAAGSTSYEMAACGLPAILLVMAENQEMLARKAQDAGIAINLGDYRRLEADQLWQAFEDISTNFAIRSSIAKKGRSLIDGKGAERVAGILAGAIKK